MIWVRFASLRPIEIFVFSLSSSPLLHPPSPSLLPFLLQWSCWCATRRRMTQFRCLWPRWISCALGFPSSLIPTAPRMWIWSRGKSRCSTPDTPTKPSTTDPTCLRSCSNRKVRKSKSVLRLRLAGKYLSMMLNAWCSFLPLISLPFFAPFLNFSFLFFFLLFLCFLFLFLLLLLLSLLSL